MRKGWKAPAVVEGGLFFIPASCDVTTAVRRPAPTPPSPLSSTTQDMYELDDDFIDDSALFEMFEKQHEAQSVVTKYTGFFVNKGDLEVIGHKDGSRASLGPGPGKERKKKARKSGGERDAPGKKKRTGEGEEGSGGIGEGGGHAKGRKTKGGKAGPGGDEGSVVSTGSTKTAGEGGGSTSSKQSQKIKGREMEGAALREFKGRVAEWGRGGQGEKAKTSDTGTAESIPSTWLPLEDDGSSAVSVKKDSEGLPPSLRGAALALDVVMRRKGGEPRWRSAQPGEQGMSSSYVDTVLQPAFPLKMGKEQNVESIRKAWRKGLAEAALARVKELDTSIEKSLNDFRRHYELKKQRLLKRSSAGGKTEGKVGEEHEEGKEQGKDMQGMPPPRSVALDAKLKHYIVTLLSSLKERCNIQALYAGQGIEGGADQVEAGGSLPRVAPRYEEEERRTLLALADTWPNGEMKIPRLRRALNAYKGKQKLLQSVAGVAGGGPGREEKVEAAGGTSSTSSKESHGKDRKGGKGLVDKVMTGKKVKKTAEVRKQVGPRKGSFVNLQVRPYDPKDFEVDAKRV